MEHEEITARFAPVLTVLAMPEDESELPLATRCGVPAPPRAAARNQRLVHVASYADGLAAARVCEVDRDDPLARLRAGENIVVFRTARYDPAVPMTIAGPGAGREVTAAGILAEVLALS